MPAKLFVILVLISSPILTAADALYQYDKFLCLKEFGLFEYSKLSIYEIDNLPNNLGYQKSHNSEFQCELDGEIKIDVTKKLITISHSGRNIFSGPKILDRIRVFSDPKTIHTIELCSWHSEIHGGHRRPGGCLFRGFPKEGANWPSSPGKVIRILSDK